jgi:signal transduction histidine kinase
MTEPSIPSNEKERLFALREFDVVNTAPEQEYDDIVTLAAQICSIGTAHVSLIDSERQWLKAQIGLGVQNLDRNLAFCAHTILQDDIFVVPDASKDSRFHDHPMVISESDGIRFYAGLPLTTSEGYNLGALCVIDTKPRELTLDQVNSLRILSKQVIKQLELRKANKTLNVQSQRLQDKDEINKRLLFIIGHDVRSPLASLKGLMGLVKDGTLTSTEFQEMISQIMSTLSSADRLLNDLLQWAASHQEKGTTNEEIDLQKLAESISNSFSIEFSRKQNRIKNLILGQSSIIFDKNILLFVLRNLLLNANKFTEEGFITIEVSKGLGSIKLSVSDTGQGMSAEQMLKLFNWENRSSTLGTKGEKGSGLALLLCQDLLRKNGGDLFVESKIGKGSTFSVVLPN